MPPKGKEKVRDNPKSEQKARERLQVQNVNDFRKGWDEGVLAEVGVGPAWSPVSVAMHWGIKIDSVPMRRTGISTPTAAHKPPHEIRNPRLLKTKLTPPQPDHLRDRTYYAVTRPKSDGWIVNFLIVSRDYLAVVVSIIGHRVPVRRLNVTLGWDADAEEQTAWRCCGRETLFGCR